MSKIKTSPIYVLYDTDRKNFIGSFPSEQKALDAAERECLSESVVLVVTAAFKIIPPEEPEMELINVDLDDVLDEIT